MADRKLPSSLFFPKARISRPKSSGRYLHLLEKQNGRDLFVFICSAQPGLTVTSFGPPKRCPLCSQRYPIGTEKPIISGATSD
jgi:rubrerythrin